MRLTNKILPFILVLIALNTNLLQAQETFGVPIPVIGIDPNEGTVLGILLAVVTEEEARISRIMAPVAAHNDLVGYSLDFNYFAFPEENITYKLYLSHTSKNFWGYRGEYEHQEFLTDFVNLNANLLFDKSASSRFFGIGPETEENDETSYTRRRVSGSVSCDINLGKLFFDDPGEVMEDFFFTFAIAGNRTWIRKGVVKDIPSLEEKFSGVEGARGGHSLSLMVALGYDSRDSLETITAGLSVDRDTWLPFWVNTRVFFEIGDKSVWSSFSFQRFGVVGRFYFAIDEEERFVTAIQAVLEYMEGDEIPFYALSSLGGSSSLRGFGAGRFYDRHRILCNIEERMRLYRWPVGEISLDIETAIFLDIGQVTPSLREIKASEMKTVAGIGVRFVVRPQIVAKVDFGYGSEGSQVYAGLDYPF